VLRQLHVSHLSSDDVLSFGSAFVSQCQNVGADGLLQYLADMIEKAKATRIEKCAAARAMLEVLCSVYVGG
jgi:hypothetical protein